MLLPLKMVKLLATKEKMEENRTNIFSDMAEKFQNKYRIKSHRRPYWDYAGNGLYFITLMIQNRLCLFGHIENKKMHANMWGTIAINEWFTSFDIRQELSCIEFVLMPNHIHAIVELKNINPLDSHGHGNLQFGRGNLSTNVKPENAVAYRKPKSISSFISGYKSSVTTQINNSIDNNLHPFPYMEKFHRKNRLWQTNYHDHIIRNEESLNRIANYIKTNPENWEKDDQFKT